MPKILRIWVASVLFLGLACGLLLAQSRETGVIQGRITDEEGTALPGVSLTTSSVGLMGVRSAVTDKEGRYRLVALPTGTYTIEASLEGFSPIRKTNIAVHSGAVATLDIVLVQAKLAKEVIVTGAEPMVDVSDASLGKTYITKDLLDNLPTAQSSYALVDLAPGVALAGLAGSGAAPAWTAYGGGDFTGNSYQLDGVELVDAWYGGGSYTAMIDYNSIEESQIISLGAPAEYGNYTGAIISIITKSGGNKLSGDAQFLGRGKTWQSNNINRNDPKWSLLPEAPVSNLADASVRLGGPIIKDKLWFFGSFEYYKSTKELGPKTSPLTFPKYLIKLTFQPSEKDRIVGFFAYQNLTNLRRDFSPTTHPDANGDNLYTVHVMNLSFLHTFSPSTLLDLKFAGYYMPWSSIPSSRNRNIAGHYDLITGEMWGNRYYWATSNSRRYSASGSLSQRVDRLLGGSHDFKLGAEAEKSWGGNLFEENGPDKAVYYDLNHEPYLAVKSAYNMWAVNWRYSFYAQDDWKIGEAFVLNPGLRFNIYRGSVPDLPQPDKTVYKPTGLEPRLGFVWDIFKTHKTALKAHYGRYYEGTKTYYISSMTPASDTTYYSVGPNWSSLTPLFTISGASLYSIDPNIKHPSMDQIVAGVEQVLGKDLSASVSLIYRKWRNFIESVDTKAIFEPVSFTDPETGQVYTVYNQVNPGQDHYLITNPEAGKDIGAADPNIVMVTPELSYRALQFTINKRFSNRWQLSASYVYSRQEGTYSNIYVSAHQYYNMNSTSVYMDPTNQINIKSQSKGVPHVLKVQGTYVLPLDISLSAFYSYNSGLPWARCLTVTSVDQPTPPYLLTEPAGSRRLPATNNLDLRVEKSFRYRNYRLSLMLDMFNVFNQGREISVQDIAGSIFGKPLFVNAPRTYRAGVRIWF